MEANLNLNIDDFSDNDDELSDNDENIDNDVDIDNEEELTEPVHEPVAIDTDLLQTLNQSQANNSNN